MILTKDSILAEAIARTAKQILLRGKCAECTGQCEKSLHGAIDCATKELDETGKTLGYEDSLITPLTKELAFRILKNLK